MNVKSLAFLNKYMDHFLIDSATYRGKVAMATEDEVILASRDAVQAQLRQSRKKASPWPDKKLGRDDGAGYNFSNRTLRPFIKKAYERMKADPVLVSVANRFGLPERLPIKELLDGDVSHIETWVAGDVCGQLGL